MLLRHDGANAVRRAQFARLFSFAELALFLCCLEIRRTVKRNRQEHSYDGESDSGDVNHRDDSTDDDDDDDNDDDDGDDDDDAIDPRRNRAFEKRRAFDYEGRRGGSVVNYAEVESDDDMSDDDRAVYEASKLKAEQYVANTPVPR